MIVSICFICRRCLDGHSNFFHFTEKIPQGITICENCSKTPIETRNRILEDRNNRNFDKLREYFHTEGVVLLDRTVQKLLDDDIRLSSVDLE